MIRFFAKAFDVICAVGWLYIGYEASTTIWPYDGFIAVGAAIACFSSAIKQVDFMLTA